MNDAKKLIEKVLPALAFLQRYLKFIYFIFFIALVSLLIYQINHFASVKPSEEDVSSKLETISRPHIDQAAVDKMLQLRDQNVQVQTLIRDSRDNPFSEN